MVDAINSISRKPARLAATDRAQVAMGINPLVEKRRNRQAVPILVECTEDFIKTNSSLWTNEKYIAQWTSMLET